MKISTGIGGAAAGLAFALSASFGFAQDRPDEITVAFFLEWPTANQIAQMEGTYSEKMGVNVHWRAFGNGNEMSRAMASGDVQIAYSQGLVPYVVAVSGGLPLKLVGVAVSYAEADNCVVSDASGITRANAGDLEGRKVATPIGNVTHYKLLRMLDHLGVDASKVDMVQMTGADAAAALVRGDVVMGCAFGGPLRRMKETGKELMSAAEQETIGIRLFDVVSVTEEFATKYPEMVRQFMQISDAANKAYRTDPDKYVATISKAAGMELAATRDMLAMFSFPTAEEQASDAWLGGTVQDFTKQVADFFVAHGQMDKALDDYSGAIDASYLK